MTPCESFSSLHHLHLATRKGLNFNVSHADKGFEVMEKVETLFSVVVCGMMIIGKTLSGFVLKIILHVPILVLMGKDAILYQIRLDFP